MKKNTKYAERVSLDYARRSYGECTRLRRILTNELLPLTKRLLRQVNTVEKEVEGVARMLAKSHLPQDDRD